MGLSISQLPPLTPVSNENSFTTAAAVPDFKVFASAKPSATSTLVVAKADSIDHFLADVMPTGASFYFDEFTADSMDSIEYLELKAN